MNRNQKRAHRSCRFRPTQTGCVPSKAVIRAAKAIAHVKNAKEYGVVLPPGVDFQVDFDAIMRRMRRLRAHIAPVDGHDTSVVAGTHVYQGRGIFTSPNTIEVNGATLTFSKAVIATGGRPMIPNVPGLQEAPYTTNEILFNLEVLPPRMVVLGAGVVALEMAQSFALFGAHVTVLQRGKTLFESKHGDGDAAQLLKEELEKSGVRFVSGSTTKVETLRPRTHDPKKLPLMKVSVSTESDGDVDLECECLLVATGRLPNVENLGLEAANVEYEVGKGIKVNDLAQSVSNPGKFLFDRQDQRCESRELHSCSDFDCVRCVRRRRLCGRRAAADSHEWRDGESGGSELAVRRRLEAQHVGGPGLYVHRARVRNCGSAFGGHGGRNWNRGRCVQDEPRT
jgi:thioredoxin reductase